MRVLIMGCGRVGARLVTRIYDPQREEIFRQLGLVTFSPTTSIAGIIHEAIER